MALSPGYWICEAGCYPPVHAYIPAGRFRPCQVDHGEFTGKNDSDELESLLINDKTFNGINMGWATLSSMFTCVPPSDFWTTNGRNGHCFKKLNLWVANSTLGMILDFAVALLPIPWIRQLRLPMRQKVLLGAVFVLGGLPCLLAVIRLQSLIVVAYAKDPSWDNSTLACFSASEVYIGIVCACLPTLKAFCTRMRPRLIGSSIYSKTRRACRRGQSTSDSSTGAWSVQKSPGFWSCFGFRRRNETITSDFESTIHLVDRPRHDRLDMNGIRVVQVIEQDVEIASRVAKPEKAAMKFDYSGSSSHNRTTSTALSANATQSS